MNVPRKELSKEMAAVADRAIQLDEMPASDNDLLCEIVNEITHGIMAYGAVKDAEVAVNAKFRELGVGIRIFLTTI